MLEELKTLLAYCNASVCSKKEYITAISEENCLGKRSAKTRMLTYRHMASLYALDSEVLLFRALLYFWYRDTQSQPLLALLCAYARDTILRDSATFIRNHSMGERVSREALEAYIDSKSPGRLSQATLRSTAQNINASWTQTGHLRGRRLKIRSQAMPGAGCVAYALFLGYLTGARGGGLFQNEFTQLLDCKEDTILSLAEEASRKGWITLKRIEDVVEVQFPELLSQDEVIGLYEQN